MTDAIAATTATQGTSLYTTGTGTVEPKKSMDQEVFLSLLVAQLRNQDPSSPMDTTEMMAQSTQMASMEQLTTLTDTTRDSFDLQTRIAAANLVGRQLTVVDDDGAIHSGIATNVDFTTDVPMITVDGTQVALDGVTSVSPAPTSTASTQDSPTA